MKIKWIALPLAIALSSTPALAAEPADAPIDSKALYGALLSPMSTTYACQDVLNSPSDYSDAKTLTTNFFKVALTKDSTPPEQAVNLIEKQFTEQDIQGKTKAYFAKEKASKPEQVQYCQALVYDSYKQVASILPNQS